MNQQCAACNKALPTAMLWNVHGRGWVCEGCYNALVAKANAQCVSIVNWNPWPWEDPEMGTRGSARSPDGQDFSGGEEVRQSEEATA